MNYSSMINAKVIIISVAESLCGGRDGGGRGEDAGQHGGARAAAGGRAGQTDLPASRRQAAQPARHHRAARPGLGGLQTGTAYSTSM